MALIRVLGIAFVVLTAVYLCLLLYLRAGARMRLETDWAASDQAVAREIFLRKGMVDAESRFKTRLIWGVYIIPLSIICAVAYLVHYA